jgi:hypothetical protein
LITGSTANVDFSLPHGFEFYEVLAKTILVDTDDVSLNVRLSDDFAATFIAGASDYSWVKLQNTDIEGQQLISVDTADAQFILGHATGTLGIGSAAGEGVTGLRLQIMNAHSKTMVAMVQGQLFYIAANAGQSSTTVRFSGHLVTLTQVSGIRLLLESGNFTAGVFQIYGITGA